MGDEDVRPFVGEDGVPRCFADECPSYDGKRCRALGFRPSTICEPAVIEMRTSIAAKDEEIAALRAEVAVLGGKVCAEERAVGNGGCGACAWCWRQERNEVDRLHARNEQTTHLVRTVGNLRRRYAYARDGEVTVSGLMALWDAYDAIGREDGGAA